MTLDRALELAEAALHRQRYSSDPQTRVELDEALRRISNLRITTKRTGR